MTGKGPEFGDLIGEDGAPEELERLRKAHDLLVGAGPPPELPPRLVEPPATAGRLVLLPRRRKEAAFVVAAAVAAAAFGVGFLVGNRGSNQFAASGPAVAMHGTAPGSAARASILIGDRDEVGNWPLLVRISGLRPLREGAWYELYLTRNGKPAAWCGAFSANSSGRTTVRFSIPYKLSGFDGWIVTNGAKPPDRQVLLTT